MARPEFFDRLGDAYGVLIERAERLEAEAKELRSRAQSLKDRGFVVDEVGMEEERARSCTGKRRYRTAKGAGTAAENATAITGDKLRTYRCVFCGGWHLTKLTLEAYANVT